MVLLNRRNFIAAAAAVPLAGMARAAENPVIRGRQFHNQPTESHQHRFLVEMWDAVRSRTGGKVDVTVFAENNKVAGGEPAVLDMLVKGDVDFLR